MFSQTKQVQSAKSPNNFTTQGAGTQSKAELTKFWNHVLFSKHSDITLKVSGKDISFHFFQIILKNILNPYNVLMVNLHDHTLGIASLFATDWFVDA